MSIGICFDDGFSCYDEWKEKYKKLKYDYEQLERENKEIYNKAIEETLIKVLEKMVVIYNNDFCHKINDLLNEVEDELRK